MKEIDLIVKNSKKTFSEDLISDITPLEITSSSEDTKYGEFNFKLSNPGNSSEEFYELMRSWCLERESRGWLEIERLKEQYLYQPHQEVRICELSIGNLMGHQEYISHFEFKNVEKAPLIILKFEHDMKQVSCFILTKGEDWFKLSFEYQNVEKYVVGDMFDDTLSMFLPLKCPPKIWMATKMSVENKIQEYYKRHGNDVIENSEERADEHARKFAFWTRQNYVNACDAETFGKCSVFQFCVDSGSSSDSEETNIEHIEIITGFLKHGYRVYFAPIKNEQASRAPSKWTFKLSQPPINKFKENNFDIAYGLFILQSKGAMFTDQLKLNSPIFLALKETIANMENKYQVEPLIKAIALLSNKMEYNRFCDLAAEFKKFYGIELERFSTNQTNILIENNKNLYMIRRITVTPTRLLFQPPEPNTSNRVLREYHGKITFVRVSFRDENLGALNLSKEHDERENSIIKRVSELFHVGIRIGQKGRQFHFLGCSNSQLRSAGAWFVTETDNNTIDSIRSWVGDFSKERSLCKYVSRLGLAFTSTEALLIDNACEKLIEDVKSEDGKYVFSDGIGKISLPLAETIKERRQLDYLPSACQIRYGGCKGMVAVDPTLGSEKIIQIRPSMLKFESHHKDIEFCQASKPSLLYMNRQVIWLLLGYKVPGSEIINLQNETLLSLADSLKDSNIASKNLMNYQGNGMFKQLLECGIDLTIEPFFRKQLLSLYRFHVKEVLERTRIVMPANVGRQMLGVMDETGSLEYGQVFLQYSTEIAYPLKNTHVKTGPLFICKNPCVHPGDLQRFEAVDCPLLHHMCDVIVFPAKGKRPHPNELSGSDLDGDEYFVCWKPNLMPREENYPPGDYESGATALLDEPITPTQMTDYVIKHITKPNNLGRISSAHGVHCDNEPEGVRCKHAIALAIEHSKAVDFVKTGIPEDFRSELRVYEYPDWMEKPDKAAYKSFSPVGMCYRICRSLNQVLGEQEGAIDMGKIEPDKRIRHEGWEEYSKEAIGLCREYNTELSRLMNQYGLEDEGDISCGCLNKVKTELEKNRKKNYDITEECIRFYRGLQDTYIKKFHAQFGTKKGEWMEHKEECFKKATAWYLAAYYYVKPETSESGHSGLHLLSFPWCVSEVLAELVEQVTELSTDAEDSVIIQDSCIEIMDKRFKGWYDTARSVEPSEQYTDTKETLSKVPDYSFLEIECGVYLLPHSQFSIMFLLQDTNKECLQALHQRLFEVNPEWDKNYVVSNRDGQDMYLSVRAPDRRLSEHVAPNMVITNQQHVLQKVVVIQRYLLAYPQLRGPAYAVYKWCERNEMDADLSVLLLDFVLLLLQVAISDDQLEVTKGVVELSIPAITFTDFPSFLNKRPPLSPPPEQGSSDIYLMFLKSMLFSKCTISSCCMGLKPLLSDLMYKLAEKNAKYVSFAMREYHETCYFLFKDDPNLSELNRRNKRCKMAKYKLEMCYPVVRCATLCAAHLAKHSKLEVNVRETELSRHKVVVVEAFGNTPEVLEQVVESLLVVEPFHKLKFKRKVLDVPHSHRIMVGAKVGKLPHYKKFLLSHNEGKVEDLTVLDFDNWTNLANSSNIWLTERVSYLRNEHNLYSHGVLHVTCEFGSFERFRSCYKEQGRAPKAELIYHDTLKSTHDKGTELEDSLLQLGFTLSPPRVKIQWSFFFDGYPLTAHILYSDSRLELEKVSYAPMTWAELHLFTERLGVDHRKRDMKLRITSSIDLEESDIKRDKDLPIYSDNLARLLDVRPSEQYFSGGITIPEVSLSHEGLEATVPDESLLVTEHIKTYTYHGGSSDKFIKVEVDIIQRKELLYRKDRVNKPPVTYHSIARLTEFDLFNTGLLFEFFEKLCLRLH